MYANDVAFFLSLRSSFFSFCRFPQGPMLLKSHAHASMSFRVHNAHRFLQGENKNAVWTSNIIPCLLFTCIVVVMPFSAFNTENLVFVLAADKSLLMFCLSVSWVISGEIWVLIKPNSVSIDPPS